MRSTRNCAFIHTKDIESEKDKPNQFLGITLGADYVSEHEWGIKGIQELFGIDSAKDGVNRYLASRAPNPKFVSKLQNKTSSAIVVGNFYCDTPTMKNVQSFVRHYPHSKNDRSLFAAWDSATFAILSTDSKDIDKMQALYQALTKPNVCIWLGGGGVFQNAGLSIAIADRIPDSVKATWLESHLETRRMARLLDDTGIKDLLAKAGKQWYFLGNPRFNKDNELIVWLNPCQQNKYEANWYTIPELELWAQDKGPVIKEPTTKNRKK